jgi:hypothetical protein
MRLGSLIATPLIVLTLLPAPAWAEDSTSAALRAGDNNADSQAVLRRQSKPPADFEQRVHQLMERMRPLHERLIRDDRLRAAESVVGLGIAAYEASRSGGRLPLGFIGTEALRLGLHRQIVGIRRQSGYVVEPSIGRRSFSITLRKTLD